MRIFIYELISAGGLGNDVPPSFRQEGAAMLSAIVADFEAIPGVETLTLLAHDFEGSIGRHGQRVAASREPDLFRTLASQADAVLIIAPDFDDLLATRTAWARDLGCPLLGSAANPIRRAGDKLVLAAHLQTRNIATPRTERAGAITPEGTYPLVCKPRHGAGSLATYLVQAPADWVSIFRQARAERPHQDLVVQQYHPGQPASVAFLIGPKQIVPTPGATQCLSDDGRFRYLGGRTPLPPPLRARAVAVAARAIETIPGLQGYVGVDLILGDAADGRQDVVIEINPRLTTSYIGLRQLTQTNLAEVWLRLWQGMRVDEPAWREEAIDFSADGRTWLAASRSPAALSD